MLRGGRKPTRQPPSKSVNLPTIGAGVSNFQSGRVGTSAHESSVSEEHTPASDMAVSYDLLQ